MSPPIVLRNVMLVLFVLILQLTSMTDLSIQLVQHSLTNILVIMKMLPTPAEQHVPVVSYR